jgi:hypothetical protein
MRESRRDPGYAQFLGYFDRLENIFNHPPQPRRRSECPSEGLGGISLCRQVLSEERKENELVDLAVVKERCLGRYRPR